MNRVLLAGLAAVLLLAVVFGFVFSGPDEPPAEEAAAPVEATPPAPSDVARAEPPPAAPESTPRRARTAPAEPAAPEAPAEPAAPEPEPSVEATPELGTLRIESDVPGAQVFIDRQFVGTAPVTAENVKPGTHQLNVSAQGFTGIARSIDVEPGPREIMIRFREVRLDAKAAVVHKHRLGSCTGQLVATPQGLRYETSDKDDAFAVPLADLESFQVDYQDKNLRVKVRRGKQYNFTDPDGNADRLFVFHRDVDSARQRLAKGEQAAN